MTDRNFADSHVLDGIKDATPDQRTRAVRWLAGNTPDPVFLADVLGLDMAEGKPQGRTHHEVHT